MIEITNEMLESETKGISLRFPHKVHNYIKAEAALEGKSKDELFLELILLGCKAYKKKEKK